MFKIKTNTPRILKIKKNNAGDWLLQLFEFSGYCIYGLLKGILHHQKTTIVGMWV